ncbi:MAG: hypothetical protein RR389_08270 [Christensenella sp.]
MKTGKVKPTFWDWFWQGFSSENCFSTREQGVIVKSEQFHEQWGGRGFAAIITFFLGIVIGKQLIENIRSMWSVQLVLIAVFVVFLVCTYVVYLILNKYTIIADETAALKIIKKQQNIKRAKWWIVFICALSIVGTLVHE